MIPTLPKFVTRFQAAILTGAALASLSAVSAAQTFTPPAVATSSTAATYNIGAGDNVLQLDVDAAGNVYFPIPGNGQLVQQPVGGGAYVVLYTTASGGSGYPKGVAVDHIGNAYITDYAGHLWQVPIAGGAAVDVVTPCGPLDGYYTGTQSVAVDGFNNIYTASSSGAIFKITQAGVCTQVGTGDGASVAADGFGNVFFTVGGTNIDEIPVGSTTATQIAGGFAYISGLHADLLGNLFVSDANTIDEIPYVNGTLAVASKFSVLPFPSSNSVGVGITGQIYTSNGSAITVSTPGVANLGTSPVGTQTAAATANLLFNSTQTLSALQYTSGATASTEVINTGAGSCAIGTTYTAGNSCTLTLALKPTGLGARKDSVQILNGTTLIGSLSATVQGTGSGLTIDPGTQTALGTTWTAPNAIAVDTTGNTFVADKTANTVSYIAAGSTTATTIATITAPTALAVAGDGSVYVATATTLAKIPHSSTGFGTLATVITGLKGVGGVAVGNGGSVYVADTTAAKVYRYANNAGVVNFADPQTLGSGFTAPAGLAVDAAGNLFVTDKSAGTISKIANTVKTTVVSGLTSPIAVAVLPSGSLFVALSGSATIESIPFVNGGYNLNSTSQLGSGLSAPSAIALDPAGNLYIADTTLPGVLKLNRVAATLNLGKFNLGTSSATQSLTLSDSGTASTTFGSPLYTTSGNTGDFTITSTGSSACSGGGVLTTGSTCTVSATFSPTATGTRTETLTFASNAVNASTETAALTGTGINLPKTTTTLTQVTPSPISFGQTVQVSASVAPQTGTGTPTGSVQFFVNGNSYGAAVNLNNGVAPQSITGLPAGSNTVTAVYSGDNNYASSTATALTISVSLAATTTVLTASVSSAVPVPPGTSITLTATVSSAVLTASPSGTVTFTGNGQTLGTQPVSGGVATLTSTTLPVGTYAVTATYNGDAGFATSTSNSVTIANLPAGFVVSGAPTALTVNAPGSVTTSFVVTPISGYIGGVDLACAGLPANTHCTFTPAVINFQNTNSGTVPPSAQTIQLTITTDTPPTSTVAWLLPLSSVALLALGRRRKRLAIALAMIFSASLLGLTGCGSNGVVTPTGTSTVTVNLIGTPSGTTAPPTSGAGNIPLSFSFTLKVQ